MSKVMTLEGYVSPNSNSSKKRSSSMKLGTAAKKCKGKKKGAFHACIKAQMRKGKHHHRKHKR